MVAGMLFDYSSLTAAGISSGVDRAVAEAERLIDGVVASDTPATFAGVMAPLDEAASLMGRCFGETAFAGYVHPGPEVRAAGKEAEERISKWSVELAFRDDLYRAVTRFAGTEEARALTGEQARLLEFVLRDLRKAGHELGAEAREQLRELTHRLVELGVAFERNIAESNEALTLRPDDLEGMPDWYAGTLEPGEEPGTLRVTMAYPHVIPFMENARRRDLRERLSYLFNTRAVAPNRPILEEAVAIRARIAGLFAEESWAEHVLDERMAKEPGNVEAFYRDLHAPLAEAARADIARMSRLLAADTGDETLQGYDWRYYDTVLRKTEYGVDPSEVAAYFPLHQVLDGMFALTGEVFGLVYRAVEAPTWHPDVLVYAVVDAGGGETIAHFYMDLFPREGKFSHAAAFPLVPGRRLPDGSYQQPVSAIVANFTKPTAERPSLLQHQEVETLFHEFGHILHQTLTRAELTRFAGTSTETDFVEAPSQIMEHWVWKAEVLGRFARHHESGEPIPQDLVDRLVAAKRLNIAVATLRQMQFGVLDMRLHGPGEDKDLDAILRESTEVALLPFHEGTFYPASFGHLLGGYDAGYYGYLWSEVYGDDMFSRFEDEGITSPEVGMRYRHTILERGGTRDGMDLLRDFLGREPNNQAFLHNLGI
jgi:thimet oligopeptidase